MLSYTLHRILLLVPTLLVISLLAFGLQQCTPGDPIEAKLPPGEKGVVSYAEYQANYRRLARREGLDLPVFYFSVHTAAYPDTLHRVLPLAARDHARRLIANYPDWERTQAYFRQLIQLSNVLNRENEELKSNALIESRRLLNRLRQQASPAEVERTLSAMREQIVSDAALQDYAGPGFGELEYAFTAMTSANDSWRDQLPVFRWHGTANQYHHWWSKVLRGDLGVSRASGQDVAEKINKAIGWTLRLNLSAILIAYLLAIPLGVYAALYAGRGFDRKLNLILFFLYALPSFWVATMLSQFLTNPEYLNLFPPMGVGEVGPNTGWWEAVGIRIHAFFLPVFCLVYGTLAFVTRQVRSSMVKILASDFIRTARAKGLSERRVLWRHAFPNALFPLITMFGSLLPRAIAGAVIIEQIFSIPGIGNLTIVSIQQKDWPIVYALLLLTAVLTITGILLADLLYAWADPRVQLQAKKKGAHA